MSFANPLRWLIEVRALAGENKNKHQSNPQSTRPPTRAVRVGGSFPWENKKHIIQHAQLQAAPERCYNSVYRSVQQIKRRVEERPAKKMKASLTAPLRILVGHTTHISPPLLIRSDGKRLRVTQHNSITTTTTTTNRIQLPQSQQTQG